MQSFCTILFLNCKFPSLPFLKSLKQKNAFFGCPSLVRRSSGFQLPGPHGAQFGRPPRCGKPAKNCPILQVNPSRVWKSNSANGLSIYFKHKILGDVTLFYTEKEHILRRKKFSLLNFLLCFLFLQLFLNRPTTFSLLWNGCWTASAFGKKLRMWLLPTVWA
jgi:hypothetical protein